MKPPVWKRNEIDSPCVDICVMHPAERICTGCFRTLDEIAEWSKMTPEQRADITAALPARAPQLNKRRGGRKGRLAR